MSIATIQTLLDTHLQTLTGLPPLQLENTRNIGVTGVAFSRATLLPARTTQVTIGINGKDEVKGLYQVDLFTPQDTGTATANALADDVMDHFPRGLVLTQSGIYLHILRAWREVGRREAPFYNVPVLVEWSAII